MGDEKSMKVMILTIYDPIPNFGNKLQNYAVQECLEKYSNEVTTAVYAMNMWESSVMTRIKFYLHRIIGFTGIGNKEYWEFKAGKMRSFASFNKKYLKTEYVDTIDGLDAKADYFAVGSDQVWNPLWYQYDPIKKDLFLLTFCQNHKKVCISPSFGIGELPEKCRSAFARYISEIPNLSVREEAGKRIIKTLTDKEAEVLIDPTLMLSKTDWDKISKRPKFYDGKCKYVLTYFWGEKPELAAAELDRLKNVDMRNIILWICLSRKYTAAILRILYI